MEKIFKYISLIFVFLFIFTLYGCYNGKLCYADNSVTQTNNIDVCVLKSEQKAFAYGIDSDNRIAKYGELGSLTQINVKISGKTSLNKLKETTTGIDENGVPTNDYDSVSYFTDYVKIKIRLPKNYAKVNMLDGKGIVLIDKPKQVEDDYFKINLEWIRLNKNKTDASLLVDDNEVDKYLFFEFLDTNNTVLSHYFLHVLYDVEIEY